LASRDQAMQVARTSPWLLFAVLASAVPAAAQTPVATVISLLAKLKFEVESDGKQEASTYNTFACFCKDTTEKRSTSIQDGQDTIDALSASLAESTAEGNKKGKELQTRQQQQEVTAQELQAEETRCAKEVQRHDEEWEKLRQTIEAVERARAALQESKPGEAEVFLALVRTSVGQRQHGFAEMQHARGLLASESSKVDPNSPQYGFHSNHLIQLLTDLAAELKTDKDEMDAEWKEVSGGCQSLKAELSSTMVENKQAMEDLQSDISNLEKAVASDRGNLVEAQRDLQADQLYLKDLTARCEARAKDWDQRSTTRADELEALSKAIAVLQDEVARVDSEVNERAFVQLASSGQRRSSMSFLQLRGSLHARRQQKRAMSPDQRKEQALKVLGQAGVKLGSAALSALAVKVTADPFVKVKNLIQSLLERLLSESTQEATKKGFCDKEVATAKQERDFNMEKVHKATAEVLKLKAMSEDLSTEADELSDEAVVTSEDLTNATALRMEEKAENAKVTQQAEAGLAAVNKAIALLKAFYKEAAKVSLLETLGSPVDADASGPGFDGAYAGKQESSKGILGLLDVIRSDFERTLRRTKAEEEAAAAEFVQFDRTSKADVAGKETKVKLNRQDFKTTQAALKKAMDELQTYMDLVDEATKEIEELKPMCIDTGMSYDERVKARDAEIEALKQALCILDPENVEPACEAE